MRVSLTLSVYFARVHLIAFLIALGVLVLLAFSFDTVELLRRSGSRSEVSFGIVLQMAFLKLPALSIKLIPFAALFGSMLALARLTRSQELSVTRAAGVSVWQFLSPALGLAAGIGVLTITVFNPISASMLSRYEQIESRLLRGQASMLALSSTGLWLREADGKGQTVVHALRISQQDVELQDAILIFYEGNDKFVKRIDARSARLRPGHWELQEALISGPGIPPEYKSTVDIPTSFTMDRIQDSFASPQTLSFWALPGFIATLEAAGFSGIRHRLHFYATLALPVLLCAMVLIAAIFSMRLSRRGGTGVMLAGGVAAGFLLYFVTDLVAAFGMNGTLPPMMAAWSPSVISLLFGLAPLFYLEDG